MPHAGRKAPRRAAPAALALLAGLVFAGGALAQGFVPEPDDIYAKFPKPPRFRAFLPPRADLSAKMPPPGNQGAQSSCVGWAVGYAMRSYYEYLRHGWSLADQHHLFSPAYIYNKLNPSGNCSQGTAISQAMALVQTGGVATLADVPYDARQCSTAPSQTAQTDALSFRIEDWKALDTRSIDNIKGEVSRGNPVVFGMEISDSFETLKGDQIYDDVAAKRTGGHAMTIVGYDDQRQAVKVMNSWGTAWGDKGFGWISYRALSTLSNRAFVARVDATPAPQIAELTPPQPVPVYVPPPPQPAPAPVYVPPQPPPAPVYVPPPQPAPVYVPPPKPQPAPIVAPPAPPPEPAYVPPLPQPKPQPPVVAVTPPPPAPKVTPPPPKITPPPVAIATNIVPPKPAPPPTLPTTVTPPPAPPPPRVPSDPATLHALVEQRLGRYECAKLASNPARPFAVQGFVAKAQDRDQLTRELAELSGGKPLALAIAVRPWPLCEALLTFDPALAQPRGLAVAIAGAASVDGAPIALADGAPIVIEVESPDFPSYLYVTYVQASGDAVHLYQTDPLARALAPHTKLSFGDKPDLKFHVGPPFGNEMIVAIAAASPLFAAAEPDNQDDRDFLTAFRIAYLATSAGGKSHRIVSAAALPLVTRAKN